MDRAPSEYDMPHKIYRDICLTEGANYAMWEAYDWWIREYRRANPDDDRGYLELIEVYAKGGDG